MSRQTTTPAILSEEPHGLLSLGWNLFLEFLERQTLMLIWAVETYASTATARGVNNAITPRDPPQFFANIFAHPHYLQP